MEGLLIANVPSIDHQRIVFESARAFTLYNLAQNRLRSLTLLPRRPDGSFLGRIPCGSGLATPRNISGAATSRASRFNPKRPRGSGKARCPSSDLINSIDCTLPFKSGSRPTSPGSVETRPLNGPPVVSLGDACTLLCAPI